MQVEEHDGYRYEKGDDYIATVRFNQPERMNGTDPWMQRDLRDTLTSIQYDDDVRVLILIGEGRAFCAGDDISGHPRAGVRKPPPSKRREPVNTYSSLRHASQEVTVALRKLDKLSIAAINGFAIQTGLSMALACDFRIAAEAARLGSATLRFGFQPDEGGHWLLVQHLGVARTMDFLMRKRIVTAKEALELGLVNEICPLAELEGRARALAVELAAGPQTAMRLLKRSVYLAASLPLEMALDDIAARTAVSDHHPDAREGVAAWREKRAPQFNRDVRP